MFVDFAIAYALLNFVGAIVVSRYFNRTVLCRRWKRQSPDQERAKGMIELLATTGVSEPTNNPGWFLVHSSGWYGDSGLIFFLGTAVGMVRLIFTRVCTQQERRYLVHHACRVWVGDDGRLLCQ